MDSIILSDGLVLSRLSSASASGSAASSSRPNQLPCLLLPFHHREAPTCPTSFFSRRLHASERLFTFRRPSALAATDALMAKPPKNGVYTVGDFMTRKENLHVVKTTTTVEEALEALVEHRITGFPVIDDDWKLVGVVSDYDLLALDSISGGGRTDTGLFPEVDSTWKTFNEIQKLLSKTNGKVIGEVMTPAPLVVRETTNLEDAARLLLETKYRRLPVIDSDGNLVGIITRGNVVRAALQIKHGAEKAN